MCATPRLTLDMMQFLMQDPMQFLMIIQDNTLHISTKYWVFVQILSQNCNRSFPQKMNCIGHLSGSLVKNVIGPSFRHQLILLTPFQPSNIHLLIFKWIKSPMFPHNHNKTWKRSISTSLLDAWSLRVN